MYNSNVIDLVFVMEDYSQNYSYIKFRKVDDDWKISTLNNAYSNYQIPYSRSDLLDALRDGRVNDLISMIKEGVERIKDLKTRTEDDIVKDKISSNGGYDIKENSNTVKIKLKDSFDNESTLSFKKDKNNQYKYSYSNNHVNLSLSNLQMKNQGFELEWAADKQDWSKVINMINSGVKRVKDIETNGNNRVQEIKLEDIPSFDF